MILGNGSMPKEFSAVCTLNYVCNAFAMVKDLVRYTENTKRISQSRLSSASAKYRYVYVADLENNLLQSWRQLQDS